MPILNEKEVNEDFSPKKEHDNVNSPKHYNREGAIQCFDEFRMIYGTEAAIYACLFNIHKYRYRAADKNGLEDLYKSDWYSHKLQELKNETRGISTKCENIWAN